MGSADPAAARPLPEVRNHRRRPPCLLLESSPSGSRAPRMSPCMRRASPRAIAQPQAHPRTGAGLPKSPRALLWMLARRVTGAAIVFGVVAGSTVYLLETRRSEQAALDRAVEGTRHFATPAMQLALDAGDSADHGELVGRLDRHQFVGIRVFDRNQRLVYQSWADIPPALLLEAAPRAQPHKWPGKNEVHRHWITAAGERLVEVVLPVAGANGTRVGYLESVIRIDGDALEAGVRRTH